MYISFKTQCNEFKHKWPRVPGKVAKNLPWKNSQNRKPQCQDTGSIRFTRKPENGPEETRLEEQEIDLGDHKLFLTDYWPSTTKARQGGVGIAVTKRLAGSIIDQVAVSERMAYVKFAAQR